jgi:hypothetical protein
VVHTLKSGSMCGASLSLGQTYTVAAPRSNGRLQTGHCIQMFIAQDASHFREALGEGSPPLTQSPR